MSEVVWCRDCGTLTGSSYTDVDYDHFGACVDPEPRLFPAALGGSTAPDDALIPAGFLCSAGESLCRHCHPGVTLNKRAAAKERCETYRVGCGWCDV